MIKDATYIANLIKNKEMSPIEALEEMQRNANENQDLNAFVELDIEKAKKRVKKQEKKSDIEHLPFYGVPFPLKDVGQSKKVSLKHLVQSYLKK